MTKEARITYKQNDAVQYLKLRFSEKDSEEDVIGRAAEIILETCPVDKDEIELAGFKLKPGARLRDDYVNFDDLDTEFDTLWLTHTPCAGKGGNTLLPFITEFFAKEALSCRPENPLDIGFAFFCLQNSRVNPAVLQQYTGEESDDPHKLYLALAGKLADIRAGMREQAKEERRPRKILVD
jgi:hypothetical protein